MVHCHCSTAPHCASNLSLFTSSVCLPHSSHSHSHSWLRRQLQHTAQQPVFLSSQSAYAASASRLLSLSDPSPRRDVSTAAHHRSAISVCQYKCLRPETALHKHYSPSCNVNRSEDQDLPVSLYWPYKNLPPDGQVRPNTALSLQQASTIWDSHLLRGQSITVTFCCRADTDRKGGVM